MGSVGDRWRASPVAHGSASRGTVEIGIRERRCSKQAPSSSIEDGHAPGFYSRSGTRSRGVTARSRVVGGLARAAAGSTPEPRVKGLSANPIEAATTRIVRQVATRSCAIAGWSATSTSSAIRSTATSSPTTGLRRARSVESRRLIIAGEWYRGERRSSPLRPADGVSRFLAAARCGQADTLASRT